ALICPGIASSAGWNSELDSGCISLSAAYISPERLCDRQVPRQKIRDQRGRNIMTGIPRQRDIIDRRVLEQQLAAVARSTQSPALDRGPFIAPLRASLTAGGEQIRPRFQADRHRLG